MTRKPRFFPIMLAAFAMTVTVNMSVHDHARLLGSNDGVRAAAAR
jgi:hypothetical protein